MKRSSNDSESREWRKSQRMKDSAQGGGAGGVSSKLCRMRKGAVAWVLFNEFWYIGTFLSRDANGFHFVLRELGREWLACVGLGESERISRAKHPQQSPSLAPLAVRQYKSCGLVDSCVVSRRVASEWAENRPPWDRVQQSRCIQRLGCSDGAAELLEWLRERDSAFAAATSAFRESIQIHVDIMSTRRVNRKDGASCDGKMQVHRDGTSRAAEKMVVSVFLALGEVLCMSECMKLSQLRCVQVTADMGPTRCWPHSDNVPISSKTNTSQHENWQHALLPIDFVARAGV